ncbi:MAG TPA: flagellar motor switch protein FliN [Acidimicrobiales bacterium]|nr:flagellar motor switch protein FliN [Acidimicrobiales bacterium]
MTDTFPAPEGGSGDAATGVADPAADLAGAPSAPAAPSTPAPPPPGAAEPARVEHGRPRSVELLQGVEMSVTVELGRTRMLMRDLLGLRAGSVVELDRPAGSPVDVLVNGTLLARGEVVVVDDELGVRITEIAGGLDEEA